MCATVLQCCLHLAGSIAELLAPEMICFPDQEKLKEMAAYIEQKWGLPQCVGSIDGSHILWQTPGRSEGSGRSGNLLAPTPSLIWTSSL